MHTMHATYQQPAEIQSEKRSNNQQLCNRSDSGWKMCQLEEGRFVYGPILSCLKEESVIMYVYKYGVNNIAILYT